MSLISGAVAIGRGWVAVAPWTSDGGGVFLADDSAVLRSLAAEVNGIHVEGGYVYGKGALDALFGRRRTLLDLAGSTRAIAHAVAKLVVEGRPLELPVVALEGRGFDVISSPLSLVAGGRWSLDTAAVSSDGDLLDEMEIALSSVPIYAGGDDGLVSVALASPEEAMRRSPVGGLLRREDWMMLSFRLASLLDAASAGEPRSWGAVAPWAAVTWDPPAVIRRGSGYDLSDLIDAIGGRSLALACTEGYAFVDRDRGVLASGEGDVGALLKSGRFPWDVASALGERVDAAVIRLPDSWEEVGLSEYSDSTITASDDEGVVVELLRIGTSYAMFARDGPPSVLVLGDSLDAVADEALAHTGSTAVLAVKLTARSGSRGA